MNHELRILGEQIDKLPKINHLGILKILNNKKDKHLINENKNGIHVNFSEVDEKTIELIKDYVSYVFLQKDNLLEIEEKQETYKSQLKL
jgi:hypothetical protein